MEEHYSNFDGEETLRKIGASWFVSYKYYESIDKSHTNWERVGTYEMRVNRFDKNRKFHELWLNKVLEMDDEKLDKNEIGLKAHEVKRMAKLVLSKKDLMD